MGRRSLLVSMSWAVALVLATAGSLAGEPPAKGGAADRWTRLEVTVSGGSAWVTLSDPRGRTASLNDSTSRSGIPGCTANVAVPTATGSDHEFLYFGGGVFEVATPESGTWRLDVRMERDRKPITVLPNIGVQADVFRDGEMAGERRDLVKLLRAGESGRWKVIVRSPGAGPDSSAVRLVRVGRWTHESGHHL